jgi:hypothetical protein
MAVYEALLLNTVVPQIQAAQAGDSYVMVVNATTPALRITQTGTGDSILVEDSSNPDSSPFVVTAAGVVGIGSTTPSSYGKLQIKQSGTAFNNGLAVTTSADDSSLFVFDSGLAWKFVAGYLSTGSYKPIVFTTSDIDRMTLDASGNLGLGVTPSAWNTGAKAFDINFGSLYAFSSSRNVALAANAFYSAANQWTYKQSAHATLYVGESGQHQWLIAASGTAGNAITFTQAMTLDASGRLSLGTTTAATGYSAISLVGGPSGAPANTGIQFTYNAGAYGGGSITTVNAAGGGMSFYTFTGNVGSETYTERARITSGGDFVVSSTGTPLTTGTKLTVNGSHTDWMAGITNTNASPRGLFIGHNTDSNGTANWFLYCEASGSTQRMSVRSNGGIANYQSNNVDLSDARTKTDINPIGSYWSKIAGLEIVSYKYKDQTHDDLNIGVIAQQVEQVAPEFIDIDGFSERIPENGVPLKAVYNKDLTFAAIKALQEAMARIETLEAEVAALKGA